MTIYSGFSHWKWWFSIAMLVYQRVLWKFIKIRPFFSHSPHVLPWQPLHIPGTVRRPVSQARFKAHQPMGRESRMLSTRFSGALGFHGKHGETLGNWILESWKCRRYPKMLENCVHGSHLPWATEGDHLLAIVKWYCGKIKFGPALPARIGLIAEAGISSVEGNINFILGFEVDTFPAQIATVLIANCQVLCSTFPSTKWWLGWL